MCVKKMKEVLFEPQPLQLSTKEEAIRLSSANNSFPSRPTVFVKKTLLLLLCSLLFLQS